MHRGIITDPIATRMAPDARPKRSTSLCIAVSSYVGPHPRVPLRRRSSSVRVISGRSGRNHPFVDPPMDRRSGDQTELPPLQHGLDPAVDPQLVEHVGGVGLDRILGDAEPLADLPVAQAFRDQPEDLVLARGNPELLELPGVEREGLTLRDADLPDHRHLPGPRPVPSEVDPQPGEDRRHQAAIDLAGIGADHVLVLEDLEQDEQHPADEPIEDDALHGREDSAPPGTGASRIAANRWYLEETLKGTPQSQLLSL